MSTYVLGFREVDATKIAMVGGKGANLGELARIEGIRVPDGFCITTEAYAEIIEGNRELHSLLEQLASLKLENRKDVAETSAHIRRVIEGIRVPQKIEEEIVRHLAQLGEQHAYAVRSSATAEDLPTASFAGQQDTYLNIIGKEAILRHVSKCWASLFTERAVMYRLQNGFDHRKVHLAVIVQKMVFPDAAGILFTADPVTGNRKVSSIDAGFGLGEALVSGLVNADVYKVRYGEIVDKKVSSKKLAVYALKDGGTEQREIEPAQQRAQTLTDEQIVRLEQMGRKIEEHFGSPQDIEWCVVDDVFSIVQSRPITALFPIPEVHDRENHVYVSVGHQQMMTDPMKPLGLSVWQLTAGRPMHIAGGRLFVDIARDLASPATREVMVNVLGKSDPLLRGALITILERGDFIQPLPEETRESGPAKGNQGRPAAGFQTLNDYDPQVAADLIERNRAEVDELKRNIRTKAGSDLMDFILEDIQQLKKGLSDPQTFGVLMTAMNAATWLNEHMMEWLGEKNAADTLSQSVPNNVTSEMGLALLDVADVIRPHPELVAYLQRVQDEDFLDALPTFEGGQEAKAAIDAYLAAYGMRCAGEIDITRMRWSEKPTVLLSMILSHVKNFEPGESVRKFEQGRQEALKKERELLERLKGLPEGEEKATETKRMIGLVRNLSGYREYPKYGMMCRYFVYKQALLKEAERLVQAGVLSEQEDIFYLTFEELRDVIRTHALDERIIDARKDAYASYEKLTPPRVMTSDGEMITGTYKRDHLPAGAIAGLAVSSGMIEGRARVILRMEDADMEEGDILVTTFTDPSWTPLFVSINGLVTEVGGLMTHGAVIAREYGIPAVVGVENATKLIRDGQRIRVHGTEGYVELL